MFNKGWGLASMAILSMFLPQSTMSLRDIYTPREAAAGRRRTGKAQRHTGAGGAGMHAAWKKRRASGLR